MIAAMDPQQIRISKAGVDTSLAATPDYRPETLAHWTGLRIMRFALPESFSDFDVRAEHPILTLVASGITDVRLRMGHTDVHTEYSANDLIFYGGGRELAECHWRARGAQLISLELDPQRLVQLEGGDARFAQVALQGTPRFTDPGAASTVRALWAEISRGCPRGRLYTDTLSLHLASYAHRRFGQLTHDALAQSSRLSDGQLRRVEDYIRSHLDEPLGLADLAAQAGLSRFHFARLFRTTVGCSPHQHVLQLRIERAHALLLTTDMAIADIALEVGFSSPAHFTNTCRRLLGKSPTQLRRG
jgi:AraC family transcriptional regulator